MGHAVDEAQRQWASEKTRLEMDSRNLRIQLDAVVLENSNLVAAVETTRTAAAEADARSREKADRIVVLEGEVADAEMQIMRAREEGDQLQSALTFASQLLPSVHLIASQMGFFTFLLRKHYPDLLRRMCGAPRPQGAAWDADVN